MSRVAGRRILLTRSEEDAALWAEALERRGAAAVSLPCIGSEPIVGDTLGAALRNAVSRAAWLVFTSRRGVEAFVRLAGTEVQVPDAVQIAAVGPATAEAVHRAFGRVDLVGERGTAESLADALIAAGAGDNAADGARSHSDTRDTRPPSVVLALAENAREVLEQRLRAAGADVQRFNVYRTVPAPSRTPKTRLSALGVDAVWLASPSAVTGLLNQIDIDGSAALVAIGPSTAAAIRARGLAVAAEAREPSFEGLLEATP